MGVWFAERSLSCKIQNATRPFLSAGIPVYHLHPPLMPTSSSNIKGLSAAEVLLSRKKHGPNSVDYKEENGFLQALKSIAKEPMVLLLLFTAAIYFISGKTGDGIFMAAAILLVANPDTKYFPKSCAGIIHRLKWHGIRSRKLYEEVRGTVSNRATDEKEQAY